MTQSLRDILICFRNLPHLFPFPKERTPSGALLVYCQRLNQSNHETSAKLAMMAMGTPSTCSARWGNPHVRAEQVLGVPVLQRSQSRVGGRRLEVFLLLPGGEVRGEGERPP